MSVEDIRQHINNQMKNCRACKIAQNKMKKMNMNVPDVVIEIVLSFLTCNRCSNLLHLIHKEPKNLTELQLTIWYFISLNPFPSRKTINTDYAVGHDGIYNKLFTMSEKNKALYPVNGNKYENYRVAYEHLYHCQKLKAHTHKEKLMGYIWFMISISYEKNIVCLDIFKKSNFKFFFDLDVYIRKLKYDFSK